MSRLRECRLGDLIELQRGHDLTISDIKSGEYPVCGSNGIIGFHNEYTIAGPTITIGRSGNSIGVAHYYNQNIWAHNTTLYIKAFNKCYPRYIYYLLKTIDFRSINSGSAVPSLNRNYVYPYKVVIPEDIEVQREIAEILTSLDEKIELDRKIVFELDALADELFRRWFVNFQFPDVNGQPYRRSGGEMVASRLGNIPIGWVAKDYGQVTLHQKIKVKSLSDCLKPVYSAVKTSELVLSDEYFNKQVYSKSIDGYYFVDSLWFAYNPSRINIGSIGLNYDKPGAVSPVYVVFSVSANLHYFIENHLRLEKTKREIAQKCSGSVRQALDYRSLSTISFVQPPEELIIKFNSFWEANLEAKQILKKEIESLERLRDTILPQLITGKMMLQSLNPILS